MVKNRGEGGGGGGQNVTGTSMHRSEHHCHRGMHGGRDSSSLLQPTLLQSTPRQALEANWPIPSFSIPDNPR